MAPKTRPRSRLAMPRRGHRVRSREKEPLCPPGEPLDAMQVSLCFDRAHAKVWDFFRRRGALLLAFRQNAYGKLDVLQEGQKVIVYVPQSQGGYGLVGVGAFKGGAAVLEKGCGQGEEGQALAAEFRGLMRNIYSDPRNKPAKHARCSKWRFKMHKQQLVGKGCGTSTTPWEFGVELWGAQDFEAKRSGETRETMVYLPMEWEATVPFDLGFFSIDWSSIGLADFPFKVCQLSGIFSRRLTTEHWSVMSARLKVLSSSCSPAMLCLEDEGEEAAAARGNAGPRSFAKDALEPRPQDAAKVVVVGGAQLEEQFSHREGAESKEQPSGSRRSTQDPLAADSDNKECDRAAGPVSKEVPLEAPASKEGDSVTLDLTQDALAQASASKEAEAPAAAPKEPPERPAGVPEPEPRPRRSVVQQQQQLQQLQLQIVQHQPQRPATRRQRAAELAAEHRRPEKAPRTRRCTSLDDLLESLGLGKYIEPLRAEEVDLEALQLLSERDLADLGLPLGPRRKLQAAIGSMR